MRLLRLIPLLVLAACASRGADTGGRCHQLLDDSRRYFKVQEYELATDCALQARELPLSGTRDFTDRFIGCMAFERF